MQKLLKLPMYSALAFLIYMPFHLFIVQWLSTFTGGIDIWKGAKDVFLLLALALTAGLVAYKRGFKDKYFWILTGGAITYFLIHLLIWFANPGIDTQAALLGTAYNCRLFGYAILGWGAYMLYPDKLPIRKIFTIVVAVSTVVSLLGILQSVLPKDVMTHFGYSIERGVKPAFFIDDKTDLPRIMSTIRDPNSLGAYLILPITLLAVALIRERRTKMLIGGLLILHVLALLLTFSRSAFLGVIVSIAIAIGWIYKDKLKRFSKKYSVVIVGVILLILAGGYLLRDQYFVQNAIFHADENTQLTDPNDLRVNFAEKVGDEVLNRPLGHGPGTAGLVSIQTDHVVLTENYFLQIAYEVGIQGLIMLVALMVYVLRLLWLRNDTYSKILIASFAGISISAMLLHTWSNEAIAATWWLTAGLILGGGSFKNSKFSKRRIWGK